MFIILTDLHFDMMLRVYILNERQQFKDSTLQNGIWEQSEKKYWHIHIFVWVIKKGLATYRVLLTNT